MDIDGEGGGATASAGDEAAAAVKAVTMEVDDEELPRLNFGGVAGPPIPIDRPRRAESAVVLRNNADLVAKLAARHADVTPEMVAIAEQEVRAKVPMVRDPVRGTERPLNLADRDEVMRFAATSKTHRVYVEAAGGAALVAVSGAQRDEPRDNPRTAMLGLNHRELPFPTAMLFPLTSDPRFNEEMRRGERYVAEALAVSPLMPCAVRVPRLLMLLSGQRLPYAVDSFAAVLAFYMPALQHALRTRDMCRPSADIERRLVGLAVDDGGDGQRDSLRPAAAGAPPPPPLGGAAEKPWRVRIGGAPPRTTRAAFNAAAQRLPAVRDALVARGVLAPERATLGCLFSVADMVAVADPQASTASNNGVLESGGDAGTAFEFVVASRTVALALHTALHGAELKGLHGGAGGALRVEELGEHVPRRTTPATYFEHFLDGGNDGEAAARADAATQLAPYYAVGSGRMWRALVPELRAADGLLAGASADELAHLERALGPVFLHCRERILYDYTEDRRDWDRAHAAAVAATMRGFDVADDGAAMLIEGGGGADGADDIVLPVALEAALAELNHRATVELMLRYEVAIMRCYASVISDAGWRTMLASVAGAPPDARVTAAATERSVAASAVAVAAYRRALSAAAASAAASDDGGAAVLAALPLALGCDPRAAATDPIAVRRAWHQFRAWIYGSAAAPAGS